MKSISGAVLLVVISVLASCGKLPKADAVYYNGKIFTLDSSFATVSAIVVKDGKILAAGTDKQMLQYNAGVQIDLQGKFVYPGFYDAHCHFYGYGVDMKKIWLGGTDSYDAVLDTLIKKKDQRFMGWVFGRGWDQNDWPDKTYPDNHVLDSLFPDVPVFLLRIDGHAALVNSRALEMAGIKGTERVEGGEIRTAGNRLTGLLIDNAIELVRKQIPGPSHSAKIEALLKAQQNCFAVGLTSVGDAGLDPTTIELIDSLQRADALKMRYYAMVSWNGDNAAYYRKNGKVKTARLNVRSFKLYADGALGSRGACLLHPYSDQPGHYGFLLYTIDSLRHAVRDAAELGFQLNTHCIGDSANRYLMQLYGEALKGKNDLRWRIEHAQVVQPSDRKYFADFSIIPSVQPTHATSDMPWAESRIGKDRMKGAYSYKSLLNVAGTVACGSDFPVEDINPLYGFYAAVSRRDQQGNPASGFIPEEALSRKEALYGMTLWAAYAAFEDKEKGSLEKGKFADFVVLDTDLMTAPVEKLFSAKVLSTYIDGIKVYGN